MSNSAFNTPEEAEQAFYQAFENSDLESMMSVWADREFIECIHPMADRVQGRAAVAESWRRIFEGGLQVQLQLTSVNRTQDALLAVHVAYEHLSVPGRNVKYPPIIATNIYQLIDGSWQLVLHHASPSPSEDDDEEEEEETRETDIDDLASQRLH